MYNHLLAIVMYFRTKQVDYIGLFQMLRNRIEQDLIFPFVIEN